jgi:hypothetical protein
MNHAPVRALGPLAAALVLTVVCALAASAQPAPGARPPAAPGPRASAPVLLTSCGQSPGPAKIAAFLKRSTEFDYVALATVADLGKKPYKTLLVVTGSSLKGMGAAGVEIADEITRVTALIAEAKKKGITVIGSHVEGMARRSQGAAADDTSDEQSIDAVCPKSNILLVMKDGDSDGRFTKISTANRIPMLVFEKYAELDGLLKTLFAR